MPLFGSSLHPSLPFSGGPKVCALAEGWGGELAVEYSVLGYKNLMWPDGSRFQKISESGDKTKIMPKLKADSVFSLPHGPENDNYGEKKESKLSMDG